MNNAEHQFPVEPIAIIGMACRFPGGANDLQSFWRVLTEGIDASGEIPGERWDADAYYDPLPNAPGKSYTRRASLLKGVDIFEFDAEFFGIPPIEARSLDPQQRILLEVAWEATEHACLSLDALHATPTGVFIGMMNDDVSKLLAARGYSQFDSYCGTACSYDFAVGRLSYTFDLRGPTMAVNSACSSSLLAVHQACQSLRSGECGIALAGGVNIILTPEVMIRCSRMHAISPDGRSKTFDASADGFGRGEGCGVVVLKRLAKAEADGDRVLAVIRATATNHDGHGSGRTGLSVPNGEAHEAMMWDALARAGLEPAQVSYLEAHGTGTPVGDPIEVAAAGRVLGKNRPPGQPLRIGSVKSNIGHLESAAGIAGLIKVVLAMQHGVLPPNLHLRQLNPAIDLSVIPAEIPVVVSPWKSDGAPRIAGVNSFGMGGTNAFAIVEEAPRQSGGAAAGRDVSDETTRGPWLLPISARSSEALRELARRYRDYLSDEGQLPCASLGDVCYVAASGRSHHRHRLAVAGIDKEELASRLDGWLRAGGVAPAPARPAGVVFAFSGQGSQWPGMGRRLLKGEPVFRDVMERCDEAMRPYLDRPLLEMLLADDAAESLTTVAHFQPAIFAMQVSLAALWRWWGVEPQAVVGHSMGEVAAAYVAGALGFEEAARLICLRTQIQKRISGLGGMLAIGLPAHEAERLLLFVEDRVSIAVLNSPRSCVLSGDLEALARIENRLQRDGIFCRRVQVDVANHSHQLDPYLDETREMARDIKPRAATIPMYSTVTAERVSGLELDAQYWARNMRQPVLFGDALQRMVQDGHALFLEVSPHPILTQPIIEGLEVAARAGSVLPSLRRNEDERGVLVSSLGKLYEHGQKIAWQRLYPAGRPVELPSYPWQRQRHWDDSITRPGPRADRVQATGHPLLQRHMRSCADRAAHFWEVDLDTRVFPYLADHRVRGGVLFPGAGYLEMAMAAARDVLGDGQLVVEDVRFEQGLFLPEGSSPTLQLVLTRDQDGATFRFFSEGEPGETGTAEAVPVLHAAGKIRSGVAVRRDAVSVDEVAARCHEQIGPEQLYRAMGERGLRYGPAFQGVTGISRRDGEAVAGIRLPDALTSELGRYMIHPALLDAGLQTAAAAMHETAVGETDTILPVGLERLILHRPVTSPYLQVLSRARESAPSSEGILHADLLLLDEAGTPVLEVEGLRVRRLVGSPATRDPWRGWFYELQWRSTAADNQRALAPADLVGPWLLFADHHGIADAVRAHLEAQGERCVTVSRGSGVDAPVDGRRWWNSVDASAIRRLLAELTAAGLAPKRVIYFPGIDVTAGSGTSLKTLHHDQSTILDGPIHLVQAIEAADWSVTPQLVIVTRGAQQTAEDDVAPSIAAAPLWGLARTLMQEHPEFRTRRIDLAPVAGHNDAAALIAELLTNQGGDEVALRPGGRYEMRLAPVPHDEVPTDGEPRPDVRADGAYLVTGGLSGLGLVTAEWLAEQGAGHVIVMGRSTPSPLADAAIRRIEAKGSMVTIARGDVTREADVQRALDTCAGDRPLRGVFHSAAVLDDEPLVRATVERGRRVLGPKIDGTWNLHRLTMDRPLDFFVLFSSLASMLGFAAQGTYAAGNAFMDSLAKYRRAQGRPGLSINWGPWSEVGLAARLDEGLRQRMATTGLRNISPARGLWALGHLLAAKNAPPQVGVFLGDWSTILQAGAVGSSSLLRDVPRGASAEDSAAMTATPQGSLVEALEKAPAEQRRDLVSRHVTVQVAKALGYPANRELDPEVAFFDLGMDSLRAVDLRNALQATSGLTLRSMVAFEHPTIQALSEHVLSRLPVARPPAG